MISPSIKLQRLRVIFIAYYALSSVVGIFVAFSILQPIAEQTGLRGWSPGSVAVFGLIVTAVVLAIALFVFACLLERKNWARRLLLVLGWLVVVSAFLGLLMTVSGPEKVPLILQWVPDMNLDWEKIIQYDRVQKVFDLLVWGYLIAVLQFDEAVKKEFLIESPAEKRPENGSPLP